jgi:hypothetical protein
MASTFDPRGTDELEAVLQAGAGISISARWQGIADLERLARLAHTHDATLWLWDTDTLDKASLVKIATAGKKNVIIDIRVSAQEVPRHTGILTN